MKNYEEIHIWDFPPILTFIRLNDTFRSRLSAQLIFKVGSQQKLVDLISDLSLKYYNKRIFPSRGNLCSWFKGEKSVRAIIKTVNIPLWVLIEFSKIVSGDKRKDNSIMKQIEKNIEYYTCWGKSNRIIKPKLPLYLTPEMVSIIFHFLGDGHIGDKNVSSSYRQMNKEGLNNFLLKLKHIFGEFKYDTNEFDNGRLVIPKIITHFYTYYFDLPNTDTFESYVPFNIKSLDKEFLVASLNSFLIDEANIGEVIEVYSKNNRLLSDIRQIAIKCGYNCRPMRKKYRYGIFDSYRFLISSDSYLKMYKDISDLEKKFPICGLAHKKKKLEILIRRKQRSTFHRQNSVTKDKILALLKLRPRTISELVEILNFGNSSIREHLWRLEEDLKVVRMRNVGRNILWSIK